MRRAESMNISRARRSSRSSNRSSNRRRSSSRIEQELELKEERAGTSVRARAGLGEIGGSGA
jgi:hypothetical protein